MFCIVSGGSKEIADRLEERGELLGGKCLTAELWQIEEERKIMEKDSNILLKIQADYPETPK